MYFSKLYNLFYKTTKVKSSSLIIFNGVGKWSNSINLVRKRNKLVIMKKTKNKKTYLKEKAFYLAYRKASGLLLLPRYKFFKDNTIEIEFIRAKTFQRLMNDGTLNFDLALAEYKRIIHNLRELYHKGNTLIHGDTFPSNILVKDNRYYLIDFSESRYFNYKYDFYNLFYAILSSYGLISFKEKSIKHLKNLNILKLMEINKNELVKIEAEFIRCRIKRFPGFYQD